MRKLLKFSVLLLAVLLIFGLAGCDNGGGKNEEDGIDYTNYSDSFIKVINGTNKNLIAFKNAPSPSTLISGIPALAANHGLKNDPALFSVTGDFVLFMVTEEDYLTNKDDLSALANKAFARIYAFFNKEYVSGNVYAISSVLGGNMKIIVSNATSYSVELRLSGPTGEILGYAQPMTTVNTIYVQPGAYDIYPALKLFNLNTGEITSITPQLNGQPFYWSVTLNAANDNVTINIADLGDLEGF